MAQPAVKSHDFTEIDAFLDALPTKDGALIPTLHKAQEIYGYLPEDVQLHIARKINVPASKVYGVATFYSLFSLEKLGKYKINMCLGTACYVRNAEAIMAEFAKELKLDHKGTTEDYLFTLDGVRCVGACGLAPVVMVNEKTYGRVTKSDVKTIVEEYIKLNSEH
ncbi:MAG: NAD(P)H-dependent oxidoreductase subunit E [Turicibacter sp.]|nr:NAD(P)H-dependent oxidoreductase subunit E [Turicibacter sp.]